MIAPPDLRAMQARFDADAEQNRQNWLAELRAEADQRDLAGRVRRFERIAMPLLIGFCAAIALVCLASQILRVVIR